MKHRAAHNLYENKNFWGDVTVKKFRIFIFLCAAVFTVLLSFSAYKTPRYLGKLSCDKNGNFTILAVSDPQCDTEEQWQEATSELETLLLRSDPDLVLICGDINSDNYIPQKMWTRFISPLTKRKIPWATLNGNHDPFTKAHYEMFRQSEYCLNRTVRKSDENYEETRPMNYVLPIYSHDKKRIVFAVYGMDTGTENEHGYEGVCDKQIAWYRAQSERLKQKAQGKTIPALLCLHIPLPQTLDLYHSTDNPVFGVVNEKDNGTKNYLCENGMVVDKSWIRATAKENDRGLFQAVLAQGDVKAILFGHVHKTNLIGSYKGVLLGFTGKLSTGCYSDERCRGGRVLRFHEDDPENFTVSWLGALDTCRDQPPIYADGTPVK